MDAEADPGEMTPTAVDSLDRPEAGARAIRGGVIRGLGYGANILLVTAAVPLMTRHLGVVDFGRYVTASSIVMIVAGITEFGLSGVATREYALADATQRRRLLANLITLRTVLTVLGLGIAYLLMLAGDYPNSVLLGVLIVGLGLILLNAQQTFSLALTASLSWGLYTAFELVNTVVVAGGTVLLVLIGAGLIPFFYISVISSLAALVVTVLVLRGQIVRRLQFDFRYWLQMFRESIPYGAATTVGVLYFRVALIVVSVASSATQTGYYSTAFKVVEVLAGTAFLMSGTAFPIFARAGRHDHERLRYGTERLTDTALIVGVYLSLSLVISAPFVIEVIAGGSFKPAVPVLRLQGLTLIATFLGATWGFALLSLRQNRLLLGSNALALVVAIGLSAVLVPSFGAQGAAIGTAATEFVLAGAYWLSLARGRAHIRPSLALLPKVIAAAAVAVVVLLLPVPNVLQWAIGSAIYLALLALLRAYPPEIMHALLRREHPPSPQPSSV
jgi:O-antigen/teichoic acid export membrane protein